MRRCWARDRVASAGCERIPRLVSRRDAYPLAAQPFREAMIDRLARSGTPLAMLKAAVGELDEVVVECQRRPRGGVRILGVNRAKDRRVLVGAVVKIGGDVLHVGEPEPSREPVKRRHGGRQEGISRRARDEAVGASEEAPESPVVFTGEALKLISELGHRVTVIGSGSACCEANGELLEAAADLQKLKLCLDREGRDEDSPLGVNLDHPFPRQALERLAHRCAAEAGALGQHRLGDERSRR